MNEEVDVSPGSLVGDQVELDLEIPIQGKTCSSFGECCERTAYNHQILQGCLQRADLIKVMSFLGQFTPHD